MSKINKIDLNLGHKIVNPFKTTRTSVTNPFKYSNFEGNTLPFADVFEGFEPKKEHKLKLITSSVIGSMTKLRSSITEPIINFVNRVRCGITSAWDYAKNTNISDVKGIKEFANGWNSAMNMDILDVGKGLTTTISGLGSNLHDFGKGISSKMAFLNTDVTDIGKGLAAQWNSLISNVHHNRITKDTTVSELRTMWEAENALMKEVA